MSIRSKFTLSFGLFLIFLVVSIGTLIFNIKRQEASGYLIDVSGRVRFLSRDFVKDTLVAAGLFDLGVKDDDNKDRLSRLAMNMEEEKKLCMTYIQALIKGGTVAVNSVSNTDIAPPSEEIKVHYQRVLEAWTDLEKASAAYLGSYKDKDKLFHLLSASDSFLELAHKGVLKISDETRAKMKDIKLLSGILIGSLLPATIIFYFFINLVIVKPVRIISNVISGAISKEDVDLTRVAYTGSSDEIGSLSEAFNSLRGLISSVLMKVRGSLDQTKASVALFASKMGKMNTGADAQVNDSAEVAASVLEINATIKEISDAVTKLHEFTEQGTSTLLQLKTSVSEIASNTSYFASFVDETSASIEESFASIKTINESIEHSKELVNATLSSATEISTSVRDVHDSAKKSSRLAQEVASDIRDTGIKAIYEAVTSMNAIKESASQSAGAVEDMSRSSEKIDRVLKVISEVANETKLLALNAAILSAQAGEHGKGFGVVADEISRLADRTAQNTKEIAIIIRDFKKYINDVVTTEDTTQGLISRGSDMITDAGVVLNDILRKSVESANSSAFIERATDEQAIAIHGIYSAIEGLSMRTEDIIRATEQQHSGTRQVLLGVDKIKEISHGLKKSTFELSEGVSLIARAGIETHDKIRLIKISMEEIKNGVNEITMRIQLITDVAKDNLKLARDITDETSNLAGSVESLETEVSRFKVNEGRGEEVKR
ncbi:MAG: methyl-accepting chemotaxis protein [Nitrospirota bacterium]